MNTSSAIDTLKQDLEQAKEQLKTVDENIRRITGRDPTEDRFPRRINDTPKRFVNGGKSVIDSVDVDEVDEKQKPVEDDDLNVSLASSVVQVAETRKRADASKDLKKSDKDRGRRMLGILQNTLNQFRAESALATVQPQMTKRRQIDAKLEAKAEEERQRLRRERGELFRNRRVQQLEVSLLQQKMRMLKNFDSWKDEVLKMTAFCRTTEVPHIFFKPRVHNKETKRRLASTVRALEDLISSRQRNLENTFDEIAKHRRQAFSSNRYELSDHSMDEDDAKSSHNDEHNEAGPQTTDEVVLLPSSVGNLYRQVESESWAKQSAAKKQRLSTSRAIHKRGRMRKDSSSSAASENLAMAGDEEPVLMDEDHMPAASTVTSAVDPLVPSFQPASLTSELSLDDTRTVRVNQSKLVPSAV